MDIQKPYQMIKDYITGSELPCAGAEENRQKVEQFLVEEKGFDREDVEVDAPIAFEVAGSSYHSRIDLVVAVKGVRMMVIKCAAGSLGSCEREVLAAARILEENYQIPYAVASDGRDAIVVEVLAGTIKSTGMASIPDKSRLLRELDHFYQIALPAERCRKERLIFRTYNMEYVNVGRRLTP